jgi:hypothetical protein
MAAATGPPQDGALPVIGRRERLDFPEWGLARVRAKVDTGAYSSALDVASCELLDEGRTARLHIAVRRSPHRERVVLAPVVGQTKVRCSNGVVECRPVIEALVRLGPVTFRPRLTVTSRHAMRFRMLLGREALAGRFLVDVRYRYLLSGPAGAGQG